MSKSIRILVPVKRVIDYAVSLVNLNNILNPAAGMLAYPLS